MGLFLLNQTMLQARWGLFVSFEDQPQKGKVFKVKTFLILDIRSWMRITRDLLPPVVVRKILLQATKHAYFLAEV